jgi:8-oxo-dGTP pyrophosphatase MutT (NUDIX family)
MTDVLRYPAQRHNRMICFDDGEDRFQMRAAGIAIRDGRVLVQNIAGAPASTIPGGRVDQRESSAETVSREIEEEFGQRISVGPLAFVIESFFRENNQLFHEVGFFYAISVPPAFPFDGTGAVCHRFREGPIEMEYRWVDSTAAGLARCALHPVPLRSRLASLPATPQHIIDREPA